MDECIAFRIDQPPTSAGFLGVEKSRDLAAVLRETAIGGQLATGGGLIVRQVADKARGIYEFRKGPLRLFFFKGEGRDIAVCTSGVRKSGAKGDKPSVNKAAAWKAGYFDAVANKNLEVVEDETE